MDRVARKLAQDDRFRAKCRQRLQDVTARAGPADPLDRVRRLNRYLATGIVLDGDEEDEDAGRGTIPAARPSLPWQQQQQLAQPASPPAGPMRTVSSEASDSDIDDQGIDDIASLNQAAQQALERQQAAAALAIQRHYRMHLAQVQLQRLREQKVQRDRLVARVIACAYRQVCGPQRRLAQQHLAAQLAAWRKLKHKQQQRAAKRVALQAPGAPAPEPPWPTAPTSCSEAASGSNSSIGSTQSIPAADAPTTLAVVASAKPASTKPCIDSCCQTDAVQEAAAGTHLASTTTTQQAALLAPPVQEGTPSACDMHLQTSAGACASRRPSTPQLPRPATAASTARDVSLPPGTGSSRGSSPRAPYSCSQHTFTHPQQQQVSLTANSSQHSAHSSRPATCSTARSSSSWDLARTPSLPHPSLDLHSTPPSARSGAALQQGPSPPTSAAGTAKGRPGSRGGSPQYSRANSIQMLEAVQLGIDLGGRTVASQAALDVCERTLERAQELQRTPSIQGRQAGAGAAGSRISRMGSVVQRQGSRG